MTKISLTGICAEAVFANFFKSHAKALRNYLFYKYGNEEQAEDATQEAFIKLWENCEKVPLEKAKSFLYTVANNTTLNKIAHQKVVLEYAKNSTVKSSTPESPEYILEEEQFKIKLQKAIEKLGEAQRTAFLLNRIDGKKYHEIAEMLGISVKAVEKRIHIALTELRKEIEGFR
ncbi:sigma-70 family RNA polymerase sigma factor [Flavobacterium sp. J372]|uniref:RNA polymerase sigma factor n=1 Tax=Flavobacterium sp. J372 TaxID=2898436 RepID=UPI002151D499|nr:sigma-70 family RNA polymerase sigma factor [Flavobacterium sp. J372]MCR5861751.1 sigma-70 family RNA polymerase sigma factor [Flavobacterium sp. J372]